MATYYISTTGNNSTGDGSFGNPWATLSYALSQVTTAGNKIYVNAGTYPAITTQMILSNGVSIEGAGRELVTIPLTYSGGYPCIKAETYGAWSNKTVGNHDISGIKFLGSTTAGSPIGRVAIGINFRHNTKIHDCWFEDFVKSAVTFIGEPTYSIDDSANRVDNPYETRDVEQKWLPFDDSFCVGNAFYNNIVHNSCGVESGTMFSGELEFSMQDGFLVYNNTMTALGRAGNANGVPIKMIIGFNKNTKIYNNNLNAGHKSQNYWQFAIEVWCDLGGLEIYDNVLNGSVDLCDSWDQYNVGYGARIYDNDIGYPTTTNEYDTGIIIEGTHLGTYIFRNKIHHVGKGLTVNNNPYSTTTEHNGMYIYDNLFVELSGNAYQTWGFYMNYNIITSPGVVWRNWYIQNNTFVAKADAPNPTYYGIVLPTVARFDGLYIENNIFVNFERGAVWGTGMGTDPEADDPGSITSATNIFIRNNLIYDSYNNNDPVYINSYPTTGITYSGTVKADPLFVSSTDWHLSGTSSPAYHAGRDLEIATDHDGVAFHLTTPSIGAYEVSSTTNYYVRTDGVNDAGRDGLTPGTAWAGISYAAGRVSAVGSIINVGAGSYNESTRCVLAPEVSIAGAGSATTTVNFSYAASSYSDGCIYAVSSFITNGNQSISGLTITTSSYTSARGIFTRFRNNFEVHDCVISGFDKSGINAYSSSYSAYSNIDGVITLTDPTVNFTTGLRIYNCTLNDNTEAPDNIGECNLRWSGHSDWEIYNNTFTTTTRVNNRSVYSDNIKNGKFHNNIINTRESISGAWLFALEMYSNFGGNEMYENTFNGGGTIDIAGYSVLKGDYDYSWYVHDNTMTLSTLVPYDDTPTVGITIEGHYRVEGVIVTRNHIKNFPWGITLTMGKASTIEDIDIYANIIENSASSNTSWASFGIGVIQQSASVIKRNINILNNTITGNQTYSYRGIIISVDGTIDDVAVKNNIIQGFDYGIRVDNNSGTIDSLHLVNNLIHDCGTTVYIAIGTSSTNYINTGQITTNPSFVSSSDFHLSSISSPAYHAGVNVGLATDYAGNTWNNPPSIGAYEFITEEPSVTSITITNAFFAKYLII